MTQDIPQELQELLFRPLRLIPDEARRARVLAHRHGVEVDFERLPLANWRTEEAAFEDRRCWGFLGLDHRETASRAARAAGRCVICGDLVSNGAASCYKVDCLKKWLLPAKVREEAAKFAAAQQESEA